MLGCFKVLIEGALRVNRDLHDSAYNLGRAEMLLESYMAAVDDFARATKTDNDPDVLEQSWYQLGTAFKKFHRMQEAQQAFGVFGKLKGEELEKAQNRLKRFQSQRDSDAVAPEPETDAPTPQ